MHTGQVEEAHRPIPYSAMKCFAVDIDMMDVIKELVKKEKKPILLYAYV